MTWEEIFGMAKYKEITFDDIEHLLEKNEADKEFANRLLKQRNTNYNPYPKGWNRHDFYKEILSDNYIDGFVMGYPHGRVVKQARRSYYYRGENQVYPSSKSSLCRRITQITDEKLKQVEKFIASLRIAKFGHFLLQFKHTQKFLEMNLNLLYKQLAQHYGLETQWLDFTSDFEVALFFACCKCNDENEWSPLTREDFDANDDTRYGIIFQKDANPLKETALLFSGALQIWPIGFQPFMRCHMQSGYAAQMSCAQDLKEEEQFEMLRFKHSEKLSSFIFERMERGGKVFPHEGLNSMLSEINGIKTRKIFSEATFDFVCTEGEIPDRNKLKDLLENYGYSIGDIPLNDYPSDKIQKVNEQYEDFDVEKTYGIKLRTRHTR